MARRRKSHGSGKENTQYLPSGLKRPYGLKVGDDMYVIYVSYEQVEGEPSRILVLKFAAEYSAKFFLDQLLSGDGYTRIKPIGSRQAIVTDFGLVISMFGDTDLDMLLNYVPTIEESEWEDDQVRKHVANLKYGAYPLELRQERDTPGDQEDTGGKRKKTRRGVSGGDDERPAKEPKIKRDISGLVSAIEIAKSLGVEASDVRGVLRKLMAKPDGGWFFPAKEVPEITKQVKKELKKKSKMK